MTGSNSPSSCTPQPERPFAFDPDGGRALALQLPQEIDQQPGDRLGLFLLHPVTGAVDQVTSPHVRARGSLHSFEIARPLVDPPIALSGDEERRHVDGSARKQLQLRIVTALGPGTVPVEAALEAVALIFGAVDREFAVRQPTAGRDLGR